MLMDTKSIFIAICPPVCPSKVTECLYVLSVSIRHDGETFVFRWKLSQGTLCLRFFFMMTLIHQAYRTDHHSWCNCWTVQNTHPPMCKHMHTYAYTRTRVHAHTHTHKQMNKHTHAHEQTHTHTNTYTCMPAHKHRHNTLHAILNSISFPVSEVNFNFTLECKYTMDSHWCIISTHTYACACTRTHTHTNTNIHTHTVTKPDHLGNRKQRYLY